MLPTADSLAGKPVPKVSFKTRADNGWRDLTTDELFKGKTVVVFSLPGAYTPTCSSTHLPRYNELSQVLRENGVDDILCLAVNDAFVMNEWKRGQEADGVTFIPDGNGDFARATGVLRAMTGRMTWPQVFIGGRLIGGADELDAHLAGA